MSIRIMNQRGNRGRRQTAFWMGAMMAVAMAFGTGCLAESEEGLDDDVVADSESSLVDDVELYDGASQGVSSDLDDRSAEEGAAFGDETAGDSAPTPMLAGDQDNPEPTPWHGNEAHDDDDEDPWALVANAAGSNSAHGPW